MIMIFAEKTSVLGFLRIGADSVLAQIEASTCEVGIRVASERAFGRAFHFDFCEIVLIFDLGRIVIKVVQKIL